MKDVSDRGAFRSPRLDSRTLVENTSMSHGSLPATKVVVGKMTPDTKKSATPIGADRYEEIITTSRTRREGSQVMQNIIVIINQSKYVVNGVIRF